jgi:chromosome segregation ATPase
MTHSPIPFERAGDDLTAELRRLRRDAERRYTEMDLLVSALNEHIGDLRKERDRLVDDLERARSEADRLRIEVEALRGGWFMRGTKGPRLRSRDR